MKDSNGVADWVEQRLDELNGVHEVAVSYISPFCVEGYTRFRELMAIHAGALEYGAFPAPGEGWYANVPLSEIGDTQIDVSFENGGHEESLSISWEALNLFEVPAPQDSEDMLWRNQADEILVRQGDQLRLTGFPEAVTTGTSSIQIFASDQTTLIDGVTLEPNDDWVYLFPTTGSYTAKATYHDGLGHKQEVEVDFRVVDGQFNGDPQVGLGVTRPWQNPRNHQGALPRNRSRDLLK